MISETTATHHDEKTVTIYVESTPHEWPRNDDITYAQVVAFEFPDFAQHPEINYSVTFERGQGNKPEGVLLPGGTPVKVKEGMIFHVSDTGQS